MCMIFFKIVLTWSWIYGFLGFLYKDSFYSLKFNSYNSLDFWISGFLGAKTPLQIARGNE